jgi:hypothetical protein
MDVLALPVARGHGELDYGNMNRHSWPVVTATVGCLMCPAACGHLRREAAGSPVRYRQSTGLASGDCAGADRRATPTDTDHSGVAEPMQRSHLRSHIHVRPTGFDGIGLAVVAERAVPRFELLEQRTCRGYSRVPNGTTRAVSLLFYSTTRY